MDEGVDEKLTEKEALAQAKAEGIEFRDYWTVEGEDTQYETEEEAKEAAGDKPVLQHRTQV